MASANASAGLPVAPRSVSRTLASGMVWCVLACAGSCTPAMQPASNGKLSELVDLTVDTEDYFAEHFEAIDEQLTADFQVGEPVVQTSPVLQASAEVFFTDGAGDGATVVAQGSTTVSPDPDTGIAEQVTELIEDGVTRTLTQTLSVTKGTLTIRATLTIQEPAADTTTLQGGWTYSPNDGIQAHPETEPGFHAAVAEMLHVTGGDEAAPGLNLTMVLLGNMAATNISYLLDELATQSP